jgi:hypothetical protein
MTNLADLSLEVANNQKKIIELQQKTIESQERSIKNLRQQIAILRLIKTNYELIIRIRAPEVWEEMNKDE